MRWIDRYRRLTFWNKVGFWGAVAGILSLPVAVFLHVLPSPQPVAASSVAPYRLETDADYVRALAKDGSVLWSYSVDGRVAAAQLLERESDEAGAIVGVGGPGTDEGRLLMLNAAGEMFWSFDTNAPRAYVGGGSGKLAIRTLTIDLLDGEPVILAIAQDSQGWYPSRFVLLDAQGRLMGAYWHPGHVHHARVFSPYDGSEQWIVLTGLNNDLRRFLPGQGDIGFVTLLDPDEIGGEAPPRLGRFGQGTELWYGVIVPRGATINRFEIRDPDQDGRRQICVWTSNGSVLYLDSLGRVMSRARSDGATGEADFRLLREVSDDPGGE